MTAQGGAIKIGPMEAGDHVDLFTLSGEKVRSLEPDGMGVARWDGRTALGRDAVGGLYFYVVVRGGKAVARGKIGLIR